jgi:hypothetical protein
LGARRQSDAHSGSEAVCSAGRSGLFLVSNMAGFRSLFPASPGVASLDGVPPFVPPSGVQSDGDLTPGQPFLVKRPDVIPTENDTGCQSLVRSGCLSLLPTRIKDIAPRGIAS